MENKLKLIEESAKRFEDAMGIKLSVTFNGFEEGAEPDDEFGNYLEFEVTDDLIDGLDEPLCIVIYETGSIKFYHDACSHLEPISPSKITKDQFNEFVNEVREYYNEYNNR